MEPLRKLKTESVALPVDTDKSIEGMYMTLNGLHGEMIFDKDNNGQLKALCYQDPWRCPENYLTFDDDGQLLTDWNPNWDFQVQHCLIKYINTPVEGVKSKPLPVVYPTVVLEKDKAVHAVIEQCGCSICELNLIYEDDSDFYNLEINHI